MPKTHKNAAEQLMKLSSKVSKPLTRDDLTEIAEFTKTLVITRTKAGYDINRQPFTPYTDTYTDLRVQKSLSTRPDLAVTGKMIGSLSSRIVSDEEIRIGVSGPEATKAASHNAGVNKQVTYTTSAGNVATRRQRMPQREWIGIRSSEDIAVVKSIISKKFTLRFRKR